MLILPRVKPQKQHITHILYSQSASSTTKHHTIYNMYLWMLTDNKFTHSSTIVTHHTSDPQRTSHGPTIQCRATLYSRSCDLMTTHNQTLQSISSISQTIHCQHITCWYGYNHDLSVVQPNIIQYITCITPVTAEQQHIIILCYQQHTTYTANTHTSDY